MLAFFLDTFTSSDRIDVVHYDMFHGKDERRGIVFPNNPSHILGTDLSDPLELSRNVYQMPHVFMPSTSLVVSQEVKERLEAFYSFLQYPKEVNEGIEAFPNLAFLEVRFKKLVYYPFRVGDFSYYDRPAFQKDPWKEDPGTLIERLPDLPEYHKKIGRYFELVVPWIGNIGEAKTVRPIVLRIDRESGLEKYKIPVSANILSQNPILWAPRGTVIREDCFDVLSPYIDRDYFICHRFSIPGGGQEPFPPHESGS